MSLSFKVLHSDNVWWVFSYFWALVMANTGNLCKYNAGGYQGRACCCNKAQSPSVLMGFLMEVCFIHTRIQRTHSADVKKANDSEWGWRGRQQPAHLRSLSKWSSLAVYHITSLSRLYLFSCNFRPVEFWAGDSLILHHSPYWRLQCTYNTMYIQCTYNVHTTETSVRGMSLCLQ